MDCDHTDYDRTTLFCPSCGRLMDREGLQTTRIMGFHGRSTLNEGVETFLATGDPRHVISRRAQ